MGRVSFRVRPACPPPFPVLVCSLGVRAGPGSRLCPALYGWVVGVCFLGFFFCFCWLSLSRALLSLSPHPLSFGLGCWLFFFFVVCVCMFRCPSFRVGRCSWLGVAGFGWVVPLCPSPGSCLRCLLGGGFGRLWWCWRAVWWLWAVFAPAPPPPSVAFFFFCGGGAACSSLCLPLAGARTGPHSVLSSGLLLAVAFCWAVFRPHGSGGLCTRWARRPFLPG